MNASDHQGAFEQVYGRSGLHPILLPAFHGLESATVLRAPWARN